MKPTKQLVRAMAVSLLILQGCSTAVFPVGRKVRPVAAPPPKCEMRQRAWCVHEDWLEITTKKPPNISESGSSTWLLRDPHYPNSPLIVIEPHGCREALADTVTAIGFDKGIQWEGEKWDRIRIRLRSDGSCDLKLLVPLYDGDPLEWAFSVGRVLIAACKDEACTPNAPTPADVTNQYREEFMRNSKEEQK